MMVPETIKVYLSESIKEVLEQDAELFEYYKPNQTINKNKFYIDLFLNYRDHFDQAIEMKYEEVKKALPKNLSLQDIGLQNEDYESVAWTITNLIFNVKANYREEKNKVVIKPTKKIEYVLEDLFDDIENDDERYPSVSGYFSALFLHYSQQPRRLREAILFSPIVKTIESAISNKRELRIIMKNTDSKFIVKPYKLVHSKEELCNYLVCEEDVDGQAKTFSIRLSRIKDVSQKGPAHFSELNKKSVEATAKKSPMYVMNGDKEILVQLTEEGIQRYKRSSIGRPKYDKVENNIYYFNCSEFMIYNYFIAFGKDAKVITPQGLRQRFEKFYEDASISYE